MRTCNGLLTTSSIVFRGSSKIGRVRNETRLPLYTLDKIVMEITYRTMLTRRPHNLGVSEMLLIVVMNNDAHYDLHYDLQSIQLPEPLFLPVTLFKHDTEKEEDKICCRHLRLWVREAVDGGRGAAGGDGDNEGDPAERVERPVQGGPLGRRTSLGYLRTDISNT